MAEQFLTVEQAAKRLQAQAYALRRYLREGKFVRPRFRGIIAAPKAISSLECLRQTLPETAPRF